jgi:hypothetical protein
LADPLGFWPRDRDRFDSKAWGTLAGFDGTDKVGRVHLAQALVIPGARRRRAPRRLNRIAGPDIADF